MDEVKRYDRTAWCMVKSADGGYVAWYDYDALLAKYTALEASIPARERAAFYKGYSSCYYKFDTGPLPNFENNIAASEAATRYPDKEAK